MVSCFIGETNDLVFDAGTVSGPHPLDHASVKGRPVEPTPDRIVGGLIGPCDPAWDLRAIDLPGSERKGLGNFVTELGLAFVKIDGFSI
jgi:hypothetical protein